MENLTHDFRETNLVLQLIQESQIKSKTVMSSSSRKKKRGHFLYCLFCPRLHKFWISQNMAEWCPMEWFWICLVKVSRGFKWVSSSKYASAQNMTRLWIYEGYTGCWICLKKPWYTFIMSHFFNNPTIWLNIPAYNWINKVYYSECVWCSSYLQVTVRITEQLWRQTYSEHWQISKTERFAKIIIIIIMRKYNQKFFREKEGGGLWNKATSINILPKTPEKEAHRETFWSSFS